MSLPIVSDVQAPWYSRTWVGLCVLAGLIVGAFYFLHIPPVAHFITYWTGQDNMSGGHYGLWSGFLGSIQPGLIVTAIVLYWHSSCHVGSCWLPGRHHTADGSLKLCRWHHPEIRGRKLSVEVISELHALGVARQRARR